MDINEQLQQIGLNSKEAKIYLAILQLDQDTVYNISKKSNIKRSTCYVILEDLKKKGLVTEIEIKGVLYYIAANPQKLLNQIKQKEMDITSILPELKSIYNSHPTKPKIQLFEGIQGMTQIYDMIINHAKTSQEVLCYGTMSHFYAEDISFQKQLRKWLRETKKNKTKIREIMQSQKDEQDYFDKVKRNNNPKHKVKFMPEKYHLINDNIIFGNKIAIFSTKKDFFVTLIESEEIVTTYKNLFKYIWGTLR